MDWINFYYSLSRRVPFHRAESRMRKLQPPNLVLYGLKVELLTTCSPGCPTPKCLEDDISLPGPTQFLVLSALPGVLSVQCLVCI